MKINAVCFCNDVKLEGEIENKEFYVCHCSMCRRWGGGPAFGVDTKQIKVLEGNQFISQFKSSDWAHRAFCQNCGTHLFYKLDDNTYSSLNLGIIEESETFKFSKEIYIDNHPQNYNFSNETKKLTEQDVIDLSNGDKA